jgi:hypothetical protein
MANGEYLGPGQKGMRRLVCTILFFVLVTLPGIAQHRVSTDIDWPDFLARHDLVWEQLPRSFKEAAWTGNGLIGSYLWYDTTRQMIRLQVFRSDVQEHRPFTQGHSGVTRSRLQIGSFYLQTKGIVTGGQWREVLWDAEVQGVVHTTKGEIRLLHFTHATDMAIVTQLEPSAEEQGCHWIWEPAKAATTRLRYAETEAQIPRRAKQFHSKWISEVYDPNANPEPVITKEGGTHTSCQVLQHGGDHAVSWREIEEDPKITLLVNVSKRWPHEAGSSALASSAAVREISEKIMVNYLAWLATHRAWWHRYYPLSFVSLPDTRLETVYWVNMYKLACATRASHPIMDTAGLWQVPSKWPFITWNLNVQLCYWPTVASNRIGPVGLSLPNRLNEYKDSLIQNVEPATWRTDAAFLPLNTGMDFTQPRFCDYRHTTQTGGHLTWAMHNCYQMYRATMDDAMLRDMIYPILRRAVNFQFHLLVEHPDGNCGFENTNSPEYGNADNCNYELATFSWGCKTLLEICDRLRIDDPLIPKWTDALDRLVPFPYDQTTGYRIGSDEGFEKAHRHYSHLLHVYPFYLTNPEQEGGEERISTSLQHFYRTNRAAYEESGDWGVMAGYTLTGLSSLYAAIGRGDSAMRFLNEYVDYNDEVVYPNGMYGEAGPCLETPLSAAQSVHDMLLQSWGDKIRVFPAIPASWEDVSYHDLRAEGGFLVGAVRKDGITQFVSVQSTAGEPCVLDLDFTPRAEAGVRVDRLEENVYRVDLKKGQSVVLTNVDIVRPRLTARPVEAQHGRENWYGINNNRTQMQKNGKEIRQ